MKTLVSIIAIALLSSIATTLPQAHTTIDYNQPTLYEILNPINPTLVNGGHNFENPEVSTPDKPWDQLNIKNLYKWKGIYDDKVEKLEELPELMITYFHKSKQFLQEIISYYPHDGGEFIKQVNTSANMFKNFADKDDIVGTLRNPPLSVYIAIQYNYELAMDLFKKQYPLAYKVLKKPFHPSPLAYLYRTREKAFESLMSAHDYVRDYPNLEIYRNLLLKVKREIKHRNI